MKETPSRDKVSWEVPDLMKERVEALRRVFPEAVCEGKVYFEKLRAALGEEVETARERYSFSWAGKQEAIRPLQAPSRATLVPAPGESVDFEATGKLFFFTAEDAVDAEKSKEKGRTTKNAKGAKENDCKGGFYRVTDPDKGQRLTAYLDEPLDETALKALSLSKNDLFICRDTALSDELAANLALQCRL